MPKRKKELVGWTYNEWDMAIIEHGCVQDIFHIDHNMIFKTKQDACDMLCIPDGKYKPVKVRITIEEVS